MGHGHSERDFHLYLATDIFLLLPSSLSPTHVIFISSAASTALHRPSSEGVPLFLGFWLLPPRGSSAAWVSSVCTSSRQLAVTPQLPHSLHTTWGASRPGSRPRHAGTSRRALSSDRLHLQRAALLLEGADVPPGISHRRSSSLPCPRSTQLHVSPRSRGLAACGRLSRPRD